MKRSSDNNSLHLNRKKPQTIFYRCKLLFLNLFNIKSIFSMFKLFQCLTGFLIPLISHQENNYFIKILY
jgi:hypothetical protein